MFWWDWKLRVAHLENFGKKEYTSWYGGFINYGYFRWFNIKMNNLFIIIVVVVVVGLLAVVSSLVQF